MNRRSPSHEGRIFPADTAVVGWESRTADGAAAAALAVALSVEVDRTDAGSESLLPLYRREPWWTSRPEGNMNRRSCQDEEEEDMVVRGILRSEYDTRIVEGFFGVRGDGNQIRYR